ncbi:flavin monoamine oxidase family protein [Rhodococcus wratislaviensis]|uniref:flavin monoamine oxidase family protein n=1 Tax=Rhodococcus wratislaviensis TaxID=44752 RepID=UPI003514156A
MNSLASADIAAEVAIVGAGISGSAAAYDLLQCGVEDIVVLEASDQPGGRVRNMSLAGVTVDAGAQFVGPTQTALRGLLTAFDLPLVPINQEGRIVSPISTEHDNALELFADALTKVGSSLDLTAPWTHPDAKQLDSMTVIEWARRIGITDRKTLDYISGRVESAITGPGEDVSALWYAYFIEAAGGWHEQTGGTLESRVSGGTQQIPLCVGDMLEDRLRLNTPVVRIEQNEQYVRLVTAGGTKIVARQAILACSPREIARMHIEPALPPARSALNSRWCMGAGMKFAIAFEDPFWRDLGFNGQIISDYCSPVGAVLDNAPVDSSGPGILVGFASPRRLEKFLPATPEQRARVVEAHIHHAFGVSAPNAIDYTEHLWRNEPWVSGCMSPNRPGTILDSWHCIRRSEGRLHFAGTETSDVFNGYMEGAIRAAYRATSEVTDALAAEPDLSTVALHS